MKKALAVGLSLLLIVTAIFALSLSGTAAATPTTTVKVGSTVLSASSSTMNAGNGTVTFDAATGTLTLNNATGLGAITGADGHLTVIANGTNTLSVSSGFTVNLSYGVTFGGNGSLTMTSAGYGVYVDGGDLVVTDGLTLDIDANGINYVFGTKNKYNIVFEENCKVILTGSGERVIFQNGISTSPSVIVKDSADVTVNAPACTGSNVGAVYCANLEVLSGKLTVNVANNTANAVNCTGFRQEGGTVAVSVTNGGTDAFKCTGFEKTGGDMTVTVAGDSSKTKIQGIYISGNDSTVAKFAGGNLTVNMSSACTAANAVHAFYLHHVAETNFSGTNVTLNVSTPKEGDYSSAILTGWSKEINLTGGSIVANLDANTTGLICPRYGSADMSLNISGGTLTGTAPSLLNTSIGSDTGDKITTSVAVNITDGAKINLATSGGVFSSAGEYEVVTSGSTASFLTGYGLASTKGLVTLNMADEVYSVTVVDANGTSVVLNKANPSMTSGGGTVVYDPSAGTLTMTDATVKSVLSTLGDLKIVAVGTNKIEDSKNFIVDVDGGNLTFAGEGKLDIISTGMAVYARGGDLIAEGNITLTVSGKSLVYNVKNSDATDGNMIFRGNAKVTVNGTGYQALLQNQKSPYNADQKLLIEDNASVQVNIPNASSGSSSTYTTAIMIRGLKMTGGALELNLTGAADASSRALGIQVQGDNGATGAVDLLGGKLTVNHVSQKSGEALAYSIYTNYSSGITFGGTDVTLNLTSAKGGTTSGVICPANTPFLKITGGSVKVNANDKTTALITPRLVNYGFLFEMTGGSLTGTVPSLFNTINDKTHEMKITVNEGATINLATPGGALYSTGAVTVGGTATFLEGCGLVTGNEYLVTGNAFQPGDILTGVVITDAKGTTTLNYGYRTYNGSVGQIVLDPDAKTLTFDGVVGPSSVSVPGDVAVNVIGTNIINAVGSALTVNGDLTLTGTGSLELTGSTKVLSAEDVTVNGGTLRILSSAGDALDVASLSAASDAKVRILAENGTAVDADAVTLNGSAKVQIYADQAEGLVTKDLDVMNEASLTVDAVGTGLTVNGSVDLADSACVLLYSETVGLSADAGAVTLAGSASLTVLEDHAGAKGIVLKNSSVTTNGSSAVNVFVTGKGLSLASASDSGKVEVKGGTVSVDGIHAVEKAVTVISPYIKGGEGSWNAYLLQKVEGTENYILLSAQHPGGDYAPADYTAVNKAIADANGLNKDLYKDFSAVTAAVNAVVSGKNITQQAEVDAMAKAINDAVSALVYKDADYTAVNKAIADANGLNKDLYKDFSAVTAAVNAVVPGKNITQQTEVDAMAKAINDAIAGLETKEVSTDTGSTNPGSTTDTGNKTDTGNTTDSTANTDSAAGTPSGTNSSSDPTDNPSTSDVTFTVSIAALLLAAGAALILAKKRHG